MSSAKRGGDEEMEEEEKIEYDRNAHTEILVCFLKLSDLYDDYWRKP